ncbi:hypothetical protein AX16_002483 [Volvariella volvacea WC 439]|nr:hypothetical protein AX16_002483 [Volvariella volvacea WC 439]
MIIDPGEANNVPKVAEFSAHDLKSSSVADDTPSLYAPPPPYASDLQRPRPPRSASSQAQSSGVFPSAHASSSSASGSVRSYPPHHPNGRTAVPGPSQPGTSEYRGPPSPVNVVNLREDIHTPPPSWSRAPPNLRGGYTPFEPIFLIARGRYLDKGFPPVPPPAPFRTHPFSNHDICQQDWVQFLEDIRLAAKLTPNQRRMAEGLPLVSMVPVVNTLVAHAVKTHMKRKKEEPASSVVDAWNHHFFHPRKVEVILMRGPVRVSGTKNYAIPDLHVPETVNFSLANVPGLDWNPSTPNSSHSVAGPSTYTLPLPSSPSEAGSSRVNLNEQMLQPDSQSRRARKLSKAPSRTHLDGSPNRAQLSKIPSHHTIGSTSGSVTSRANSASPTGTVTQPGQPLRNRNNPTADKDKTYRLFIVATNR